MSVPELAPPNLPNPPHEKHSSSFLALQHRDFRLLWIGQIVSVTGSQMQLVAINWHVYLLTKSPLALGAVGLVRVVPIILCSLLGGLVADAFDRKRLILISQVAMLLSAAALAVFTWFGLDSVWPIYVLTAISSAAVAFDNPARQALLPTLVPSEVFPNAVSLGLMAFQISMISGPALAGIILSDCGPELVYALNALSFIAVIIAVKLMRTSGRAGTDPRIGRGISLNALREGLGFVRRTPIIVQTMTLDFIATFFASATALLPIFAAEILHVGARGLGVLASAPAVGSLLAALAMARVGVFKKQGAIVIGSIMIYALATIGFGLSRVFWLSLVMLALMGAADTVSTILRQTIRQLVTPNHLRGRMTSVNMIFFMGGPQLGEMEAGAAAKLLGASLSVVTGGIACLMSVLVAMRLAPNLMRYENRPEE